MDCTQPIKSTPTTCPCGAEVQQTAGRGRVKRYCKPSHGETWRRRMAAMGWS
ncbi:hypothetical protein SUDANB120_01053 [Streptomyces sp. enrichment culture]